MPPVPCTVILAASGTRAQLAAALRAAQAESDAADQLLLVAPSGDPLSVMSDARADWTGVNAGGSVMSMWHAGLQAARHERVILLDGDTVCGHGVVRGLSAALGGAVAVGPLVHRGAGVQHADVDSRHRSSVAEFRRWSRQRQVAEQRTLVPVDRLGDVALAIRRGDALHHWSSEGFDWPALRRLAPVGLREDLVVSHFGHQACRLRCGQSHRVERDGPLLSAVLITKNEEEVLADCLESLTGVVDEVVVYDTGSSDSTCTVAAAHGARVIPGYWDDDFGAARTRALEHARGRWALVIDADERLEGDRQALRQLLRTSPATALSVRVVNQVGVGRATTSHVSIPRLFPLRDCTYAGRLHEMLVERVTGEPAVSTVTDIVTLRHLGYTQVRSGEKDKHARNLRLARIAYRTPDGTSRERRAENLARAANAAGHWEEALRAAEEAVTAQAPNIKVSGMLQAGLASLYQGDLRSAEGWATRLRQVPGGAGSAVALGVQVCLAHCAPEKALQLLDGAGRSVVDATGTVFDDQVLLPLRVKALVQLECYAEAVPLIVGGLREGALRTSISELAATPMLWDAVLQAVDLADEVVRGTLVREAVAAPVQDATAILGSLWEARPGSVDVLAGGCAVAASTDLSSAVPWAVRFRQSGLSGQCPLLGRARDETRSPLERFAAAAITYELFSDSEALLVLGPVTEALPDDAVPAALAIAREVAPSLLPMLADTTVLEQTDNRAATVAASGGATCRR